MKSVRYEMLRMAMALSALAGVAAVFPYAALSFTAVNPAPQVRPYVAFVRLTDAEYDAALRAAKSAWQMETSAARETRMLLPLGELPEEDPSPILTGLPRKDSSARPAPLDYPAPPWKPSAAANSPVPIPADSVERPAQAFPREELLALP